MASPFELGHLCAPYLYRTVTGQDGAGDFAAIPTFKLDGARRGRHHLRITVPRATNVSITPSTAGTEIGILLRNYSDADATIAALAGEVTYTGSGLVVPAFWILMGTFSFNNAGQSFVYNDLPPGDYKLAYVGGSVAATYHMLLEHTN